MQLVELSGKDSYEDAISLHHVSIIYSLCMCIYIHVYMSVYLNTHVSIPQEDEDGRDPGNMS